MHVSVHYRWWFLQINTQQWFWSHSQRMVPPRVCKRRHCSSLASKVSVSIIWNVHNPVQLGTSGSMTLPRLHYLKLVSWCFRIVDVLLWNNFLLHTNVLVLLIIIILFFLFLTALYDNWFLNKQNKKGIFVSNTWFL